MKLDNERWERDRGLYLSKLRRIEAGISKLLDLRGSRVVTSSMMEQMEKLHTDAKRLLTKLENNEFEIAIVGLEKAGKSTFANAFIDLLMLPSADKRCTYTSTCVRRGDKDAADISFYSRREFERDFSEKLEKLRIPQSASYSFDGLLGNI